MSTLIVDGLGYEIGHDFSDRCIILSASVEDIFDNLA